MIYVIFPRRAGRTVALQAFRYAAELLQMEVMRQALSPPTLSADLIDESGKEDMTEDDVSPNGVHICSCITPSLPKHQICWYTSGFQ